MSSAPTDKQPPPLPDVIRRAAGMELRNVNDFSRLANAIAASGYFKDAQTAQKVAVKMLFAMTMGFDAIAGLQGVDLIDGTPTPNALLWSAAIEASPLYDYEVLERSSERCTIAFLRRQPDGSWRRRGEVTWTMEDAKRAKLDGKDNWRAYPRAMLHWRAMTEGARAYCPELFGGVRAYAPAELLPDAPLHFDLETGEVIEMPAERDPSAPAEEGGSRPPADGPGPEEPVTQPSASSTPSSNAPPAAGHDPEPAPVVKPLPQLRDRVRRWSVASHTTEGKRYEVTRTHFEGAGRSWSLWTCECPDHHYQVKNRGERCKHVDDVLAGIGERFEDSMRPEPAPPRLCSRCGMEWSGPGEICNSCVEREVAAGAKA